MRRAYPQKKALQCGEGTFCPPSCSQASPLKELKVAVQITDGSEMSSGTETLCSGLWVASMAILSPLQPSLFARLFYQSLFLQT